MRKLFMSESGVAVCSAACVDSGAEFSSNSATSAVSRSPDFRYNIIRSILDVRFQGLSHFFFRFEIHARITVSQSSKDPK